MSQLAWPAATTAVTLSAPANNSVFTAPATLTLKATASAATGYTVQKVEFFEGANLIGSDTAKPYSVSWANVAAGAYGVTARVTAVRANNPNQVLTSSPITVIVNSPPTAALTSPANNAVFVTGSTIALTATAADSDGSITRVEFFNGNTSIGSDTSAPYSINWNNLARGSYTLTARATDNRNATTTSAPIHITVNSAPRVSLTSPANNAVFTAPGTITFRANAADAGGSVSKVEFFNGTTLIGTDTTTRYSFTWSAVPAGVYSITAKATDNLGLATTSTPITVRVNSPPTVALTSPANNAVFVRGSTIPLSATATDDGSISKVEFFNGNTRIAISTTAPYSFNWSSAAPGAHTLTAKATDNLGAVITSAAIAVSVTRAPAVALTSPANNAVFTAPASIALAATAADDGSITQVDFYNGATLIGTVTTATYNATWAAVPAGSYTLTAKATDNLGVSTTSAPVTITVQPAAPAAMYFIHPDHLNTPRLITDQAGTVVWRWDNDDPFGNNAPTENPSGVGNFTCNLRLPGQYFDRESNLHYNYFRDGYDSATGRYTQFDPIGLGGGINGYVYVHGNPLSFTDPTGEIVPVAVVGITAIVGAITAAAGAAAAGGDATTVIAAAGVGLIGGALGGAATVGIIGAAANGGLGAIGVAIAGNRVATASIIGGISSGITNTAAQVRTNTLIGKPADDINWCSVGGAVLGGGLGTFVAAGNLGGNLITASSIASASAASASGMPYRIALPMISGCGCR